MQTDISDHYAIAWSIMSDEQDINQSNQDEIIRFNERNVKSNIQSFDWNKVICQDDPENMYNELLFAFDQIYGNSSETIKVSRKGKINPWINNDLQRTLKQRDKLHKQWMQQKNNNELEKEYKKVRNKVNKQIIWARNNYYKNQLKNCESDVKKTWNVINEILGKKK